MLVLIVFVDCSFLTFKFEESTLLILILILIILDKFEFTQGCYLYKGGGQISAVS